MAEPDQQGDLRGRFLQVAYDLGAESPVSLVNIQDVGRELGLPADRATLRDHTSEIKRLAYYWGNKGCLESKSDGFNYFTVTPAGMDEAEGRNRPPEPSVSNTFNMSGNFYQAAVGTHNTNTFTGDLDFSTVERRIEEEGGADKEKLRELVREVRELLESGQTLDKGVLARFNDGLKEHGWLSGAVAGWLLNFATQ